VSHFSAVNVSACPESACGEPTEEAFKLSRAKTKKELIHEAQEEFVQNRRRLDLLDLEGRIEFAEGYAHKG
jgi:hypothetical protein